MRVVWCSTTARRNWRSSCATTSASPREVFDLAKQQIQAQTGLPPQNILAAATHTHSATTARGPNKVVTTSDMTDYQKFLARRIADGVQRAANNLEPAQIGWGRAAEPSQVFNRRWHVSDPKLAGNPFGGTDTVRMNPPRGSAALVRPAGPVDPEIAFLFVKSTEGRPIALLANYSLHYVGGVRSGDVSADYFGFFSRRIAELLDAEKQQPAFVGILSNGTSGDVNNINFRKKSPRLPAYEKMRQVGHQVAEKVYAASNAIEFHSWVPLAAAAEELTLKVRKPTQAQLDYFRKLAEQGEDAKPRHSREAIYARRVQGLLEAPAEVTIPLQALRIGNVGISAIPFEVFTEIGLELKDKSPLEQTFTIELANGSYGYLPTPEQHKLGGYETWLGTNNVEFEASTKITRTLLGLLAKLKKSRADK